MIEKLRDKDYVLSHLETRIMPKMHGLPFPNWSIGNNRNLQLSYNTNTHRKYFPVGAFFFVSDKRKSDNPGLPTSGDRWSRYDIQVGDRLASASYFLRYKPNKKKEARCGKRRETPQRTYRKLDNILFNILT